MNVNVSEEARAVIEALGLVPHPEGGFYRETFRAPLGVATPQGPRAASTAIYFLLPAGSFSALHRVRSDEVWHHYDGDPVELHCLVPFAGSSGGASGGTALASPRELTHRVVHLGHDLKRGQQPKFVVPAGTWQAAIPDGPRFALCGCTVAPGFDFADFEMPPRAELLARFPDLSGLIARLTRA